MKEESPEISQLPERELQILEARYGNAPIQSYPADFFAQKAFLQRLAMWCTMSGIRDLPDEMLEELLVDMLRNEYGGLTLEEISLAMRMNIMGEMGDPVIAYNSLDIQFITQVINRYKEHRLRADKKYIGICHKMELPTAKQLHDFQKDWIAAAGVEVSFNKFMAGREVFGYAMHFDTLVNLKMINPSEEKMAEYEKMGQEEIQRRRANAQDKDSNKFWKERVENVAMMQISARTLGKELYIQALFEKHKPSEEQEPGLFALKLSAAVRAKYPELSDTQAQALIDELQVDGPDRRR